MEMRWLSRMAGNRLGWKRVKQRDVAALAGDVVIVLRRVVDLFQKARGVQRSLGQDDDVDILQPREAANQRRAGLGALTAGCGYARPPRDKKPPTQAREGWSGVPGVQGKLKVYEAEQCHGFLRGAHPGLEQRETWGTRHKENPHPSTTGMGGVS